MTLLNIIRSVTSALTAREYGILALIAEGATNGAICRELNVSPKTVESHVRSIFLKLNLRRDDVTDRRVTATLVYLRSNAA